MNNILNVLRNGIELDENHSFITINKLTRLMTNLIHEHCNLDTYYSFDGHEELQVYIDKKDVKYWEVDVDYVYFQFDNKPKITKIASKIVSKYIPNEVLNRPCEFYKNGELKHDTVLGLFCNAINETKLSLKHSKLTLGEINWVAGDFGDNGSCIFSKDGMHRDGYYELQNDNLVHAIKIFDENNKGIGRCLLKEMSNTSVIIWNAYGALPLQSIAQTLVSYSGIPVFYKDIRLSNDNSEHIYINNDSYFVTSSQTEFDNSYEHYDLEIGNSSSNYTCENCGDEIYDEDEVYNFDDRILCPSCYTHYVGRCDKCNDEMERENLVSDNNGYDICPDCLSKYYGECDECNEVYLLDDIEYIDDYNNHDSITVCHDCLKSKLENNEVLECSYRDCYHLFTPYYQVHGFESDSPMCHYHWYEHSGLIYQLNLFVE